MLEDFRLQVFMAVCRERSFTKAAAELGVSQPAVSQNIAELERIVGMKLFARLKGEIALTGEGEVFKDYAERLLLHVPALTICSQNFLRQQYAFLHLRSYIIIWYRRHWNHSARSILK
jgi:DNA-binding transcriptional LysR family regulator